MSSDRSVEQALEELYSSDPSEFTKKRDALSKELKKAGHKDAAAALAARRKPTQLAWILNQLARKHPDAVAELVDVGRELAREQRRALRGETSHGLRDSIERQRKAVSEVGQKAASVMKDLGVDPMAHLQDVTMALQAALIDPAVGAALEAGQLEKAPEAAAGFGGPMMASAGESSGEVESAPRAKPKTEPPPKDDAAEREKERGRVRAAHAKAVSEAKALLEAAQAEAKKAHEAAAQAKTESEAAELVLQKAREAANEASRESRRLASEASAADRTVAAAEKELAQLEKNAPE